MKRVLLVALILASLFGSAIAAKHESKTKLWYDYPADEFIESLVMGNGRMGAIIYGGVDKELINLNEMTLWSGEPVTHNVDAEAQKRNLAAIRKALEKRMTLAYSAGNIAGDAKLLQDFFKASVSCKFLARGKKQSAVYALTNNTSIGYKLRIGNKTFELPAFETTTINVGKDKNGKDKDVEFYVANMWEVDYKNPKIVYKASAK